MRPAGFLRAAGGFRAFAFRKRLFLSRGICNPSGRFIQNHKIFPVLGAGTQHYGETARERLQIRRALWYHLENSQRKRAERKTGLCADGTLETPAKRGPKVQSGGAAQSLRQKDRDPFFHFCGENSSGLSVPASGRLIFCSCMAVKSASRGRRPRSQMQHCGRKIL